MSDIAATPPAAPPRPTHADLFIAFLRITLSSIGGALPWTRRMIVERRRWMTAEEFNEIYGRRAPAASLPDRISERIR